MLDQVFEGCFKTNIQSSLLRQLLLVKCRCKSLIRLDLNIYMVNSQVFRNILGKMSILKHTAETFKHSLELLRSFERSKGFVVCLKSSAAYFSYNNACVIWTSNGTLELLFTFMLTFQTSKLTIWSWIVSLASDSIEFSTK